MSEIQKLDILGTIKEGLEIGMQNLLSILVNAILWFLTAWIPYLNVGTTIGMLSIIAKASKGEVVPVTEIFDPKYRKHMGEFFLVNGFMAAGIAIAFTFFIIPGIVISLAWSLAPLLVVDKGKNPVEAISLSNNCTYGNKFRMFIVVALPLLAVGIIASILSFIPVLGFILIFVLLFLMNFVNIGIQASLYKRLTGNV